MQKKTYRFDQLLNSVPTSATLLTYEYFFCYCVTEVFTLIIDKAHITISRSIVLIEETNLERADF